MANNDEDLWKALGGCTVIILILAFAIGVSAGLGALTMVVLAAFNVHVSFWIAWGVWVLLSGLFSAGRNR